MMASSWEAFRRRFLVLNAYDSFQIRQMEREFILIMYGFCFPRPPVLWSPWSSGRLVLCSLGVEFAHVEEGAAIVIRRQGAEFVSCHVTSCHV